MGWGGDLCHFAKCDLPHLPCLVHGTATGYITTILKKGLRPGREVSTSESTTVQPAPMLIFDRRNQAPGRSFEGNGGAMVFLSKSRVAVAIEEGNMELFLVSNGVICASGGIPPELTQKIVSHKQGASPT